MSDESKKIVNTITIAEGIYDAVVSELKIDHKDKLFRSLILGMLRRQTRDYLIFSIWNNMDKGQLKHFREYINQSSIIEPWKDSEDVLLNFAMLYPKLIAKVYASLTDFFQNFIRKFNEVGSGERAQESAGANFVSSLEKKMKI